MLIARDQNVLLRFYVLSASYNNPLYFFFVTKQLFTHVNCREDETMSSVVEKEKGRK